MCSTGGGPDTDSRTRRLKLLEQETGIGTELRDVEGASHVVPWKQQASKRTNLQEPRASEVGICC